MAIGGRLLRGQRTVAPRMPGGPVLSATFIYRQQRLWGASPVVASWQLVMSGVLQVVGLALLGLGGAFLLGAPKQPVLADLHARRFRRAAAARPGGRIAARADRRHRRESAVVGQLASRQTVRHRCGQVAGDTAQLESVSLSRRDLAIAFSWSLFNWIADVACLAFAAYAAGGKPSLAGSDGRLRGGAGGGLDPADARRAAGRRGGAGARCWTELSCRPTAVHVGGWRAAAGAHAGGSC